MSLGELSVAYPDGQPWYDLRPYLVNGWEPLNADSCGVTAIGNLLIFNIAIIGDSASRTTFMHGIPGTVSDANSGLPILRGNQNVQLLLQNDNGAGDSRLYRSSGVLFTNVSTIERMGGYAGRWTITGTVPRGAPV